MSQQKAEILSKKLEKATIPKGPKPKKHVQKEQTELSSAGEKGAAANKVSVSLYSTDLARMDEIKQYMQGQGIRNLSDSQALRLACRAVELDSRLVELYESMKQEDGRRKQEDGHRK
jgi:hypothetical protein